MTSERRPHMESWRALWDAINDYAVSCGGNPSKGVYGNIRRMNAVSAVERALDEFVDRHAAEREQG